MKSKFFLHAFLLFLLGNVFAGGLESVVLSSNRTLIVKSEDEIEVKESSTILITSKADAYLGFDSFKETDFMELEEMEATISDLAGNVLVELDNDDITESTVSYSSIYNEHTTFSHNLQYPKFPYMAKLNKEYVIKSTFFIPDWDPQEKVNVNSAKMEIILEYPLKFRYRNIGSVEEPAIKMDEKGFKHYTWKIKNIDKYESEYSSAPESRFQTGVKLEAINFDLDGYTGNADNWKDFGNWCYTLYKDNMNFPNDKKFGDQFLSITDRKERIKTIYRYLQDNTRYVQIYLGIDGWRPHHVEDIHANKYGDCKDLSVYMIAMLRQAGIDAYPGLVLTRDKGVLELDFPGNRFNHCIVVVPIPDDTLFLECTSDVTSIDNIEDDIEGVNVLLLNSESSRIIRTPLSKADMNRTIFSGNAIVSMDRSLNIKGTVKYTGNSAIDMRIFLKNKSEKEKTEWLTRKISNKNGDVKVNSLDITNLSEPDSNLYIDFNADIKFFASKAGSRLIIEPALFNHVYFDGEKPEERKMPLLNSTTFSYSENITYTLPEGYKLKNASEKDTLASPFGSYIKQLGNENNKIFWNSEFAMRKRLVSLEEYYDYYNFMEETKKVLQAKLVLIK